MKKISLLILCMLSFCGSSCTVETAKPIPPGKESFIGVWRSASGFEMEILATGRANLIQLEDERDSDWDKLNIKVAPQDLKGMLVRFLKNNTLEIAHPQLYARDYHIDRPPYEENGQFKMVLNGVTFVKE